ncbi:ABC transporter substrate-binding protein [Thermodesulfobacteriota bacterium]
MMKLNKCFVVFVVVTIFVFTGSAMSSPDKPTTVAELALYKGVDRQQILEEGARKEGRLTIYTSSFTFELLAKAFRKKYPYIKVETWRGGTRKVLPKILEEYRSRMNLSDVIGITQTAQMLMEEAGILQPFYSPEMAYIEEDAIRKTPGGDALSAGYQINGRGLGWNTKLVTKEQAPKTYQDLLDSKWKGNMAIVGSNVSANWMGTMLITYGEEYVKKLAKQKFDIHMISARALLDMVIAGEYPFSPTISDAHMATSQKYGAPVDWIPLEPVYCLLG